MDKGLLCPGCDKPSGKCQCESLRQKVLSGEEIIITVCGDCPFEGRFSDEDCKACQRNLKAISQATVDKGKL